MIERHSATEVDGVHDELRVLLGTTGRFELVPAREALHAGGGVVALVSAAALLFAPWALLILPGTIGRDVELSAGRSFGPAGLAFVVGAGIAIPALAALLGRGIGRRRIAIGSSACAAALLVLVPLSREPVGLAPLAAGGLLVLAHGSVLSLVIDLYHPFARVRALGAALFGGVLGAAAVPFAAALGGGLGLSWRGSALVVGLLASTASLVGIRLPDAVLGALDEEPARARLRSDDDGGVGTDDQVPPITETFRELFAPPSVRPLLALASLGAVLVAPAPEALRLLERDRWVVVATARPLLVGLVLLVTAASLLAVSRAEVAWRASPIRLLHRTVGTAVLGAMGMALGAVMPGVPFAVLPLAVGVASCGHALLGALVCASTATPARLRPLLAGCTGVAVACGVVVGGLMLSALGSRFGPAWGALALSGFALTTAVAGLRAMKTLNADGDAAVERVAAAERLASARRHGVRVPLLESRGIDFSYGQLQVLFDVSFTIDDGEMVALLGTNGAGKSTLLRVISGLGTPSRGSVVLSGTDITFLSSEERVARGITQVPGGKAVFGSLTVVDNLRAYGYSLGRDTAWIDAGIEQTFDAFPRLGERRNQLASTLSGGEQQMLALGKAYILEPRLLLIDELSLGLAPKIVGELLDMVQRVNRAGTAIVLVEQSVNIALSLVDHAYFMEKGEMRFDGPAASLLDRPDLLRSVFLAEAGPGQRPRGGV